MMNTKPILTPFSSQFKLAKSDGAKTEEEKYYMSKILYANVVGSMMYAIVCTRPDLSYAISVVSKYMVDPYKEHWYALKWVLRYIKGTLNKGLIFGVDIGYVSHEKVITGYVDSDFARCLDTRKSLTGYVFIAFGTTISWKAGLQKVVALSSTKA